MLNTLVLALEKLARIVFKRVAHSPQTTNGELVEILRRAGADAATARRIVAFAPNAGARIWLRDEDVTWPDTYSVHHPSTGVALVEHRPLADEPAFCACLAVAKGCPRPQVEALFRRTGTCAALRQFGMRTSPDEPGKPPKLQVGPLLLDAEYLDGTGALPLAAAPGFLKWLQRRWRA